MAPEVDRDGEMPAIAERTGDAVPHAGVRGKPVNEDERQPVPPARRRLPGVDGQVDTRRDEDPVRVHLVSIAEPVPRAAVRAGVQPSSCASGRRNRNAAPRSPLVPAVIDDPIASSSWLVTYSPIPVPDARFAVCGAR
jgi:hypothetical protein